MNELIKITENKGKQAVSARDLYEYLGFDKSQWARWYKKNIIENEFAIENVDYHVFDIKSNSNNGSKTKEFALSIEFAMRISMMAKTRKGEQARLYFIECEKIAKNKVIDFSDASAVLQLAQKWHNEQQKRLEIEQIYQANKPKVIFADAVSASKTSILIGELAKILKQNGVEMGQNRFFEWLRHNNFLISRKGTDFNMPTQKSMELGLFEIKETSITHSDGHISINKTSKVTGKGQQYFINRLLVSA
ncbi:phage antirepressor KilAC domain-containing protein [Chryseobacterium potabilaquae]|nr:phage antirepressor KilAC domain-containing protein [Chryseobacterium potabilaquae]